MKRNFSFVPRALLPTAFLAASACGMSPLDDPGAPDLTPVSVTEYGINVLNVARLEKDFQQKGVTTEIAGIVGKLRTSLGNYGEDGAKISAKMNDRALFGDMLRAYRGDAVLLTASAPQQFMENGQQVTRNGYTLCLGLHNPTLTAQAYYDNRAALPAGSYTNFKADASTAKNLQLGYLKGLCSTVEPASGREALMVHALAVDDAASSLKDSAQEKFFKNTGLAGAVHKIGLGQLADSATVGLVNAVEGGAPTRPEGYAKTEQVAFDISRVLNSIGGVRLASEDVFADVAHVLADAKAGNKLKTSGDVQKALGAYYLHLTETAPDFVAKAQQGMDPGVIEAAHSMALSAQAARAFTPVSQSSGLVAGVPSTPR